MIRKFEMPLSAAGRKETMSEKLFYSRNADDLTDPGAITAEVNRRTRYLQITNRLTYQEALEAVLLGDSVIEAKYSSLSDNKPAEFK